MRCAIVSHAEPPCAISVILQCISRGSAQSTFQLKRFLDNDPGARVN